MWPAEGVGALAVPGWRWGVLLPRVLRFTNCLGLSHKKLVQRGHTWGRGRMENEFGGQVWERWEGTFAREALCTEVSGTLCPASQAAQSVNKPGFRERGLET